MAHQAEPATIGERIAHRRRQLALDLRRDVTPADLAKMLGVNPATVYRWESGEKAPREDAIIALAKLFGVTPQFIRYGTTGVQAVIPPGATNVQSIPDPDEAPARPRRPRGKAANDR